MLGTQIKMKIVISGLDSELRSMDTPRIRRVQVSDMCRVRHDTDTCNYTALCDFFKLLDVSACPCPCFIDSEYHFELFFVP